MKMPSHETMHRAFARKDPAYDGVFFTAVKTTGVFCRPTCRARPPRPENVEFFATAEDAVRAGYRACRLCEPERKTPRPPTVVRMLMQWLDEHAGRRLTEEDLRRMGVDPSTARRQFRAYCGRTFAAYQREQRIGQALRRLQSGASVIDAQLEAGYESAGGFGAALARLRDVRGAPKDVRILTSSWLHTPLGRMVAVVDDQGLHLLDFADRKGLAGALARLKRGRPAAAIVPGRHPYLTKLREELSEYFAGRQTEFTIPIVLHGSEFQRRAWEALRRVPPGETRTYAQQAAALGQPRAVRAVARANGMNYVAIIVPCHRVIGADGHLTGYGGGLARKRWLLDHERRMANASVPGRRSHTTPATVAVAAAS